MLNYGYDGDNDVNNDKINHNFYICIEVNNDIYNDIALFTNINNLYGLCCIAGFALLQLWPQLEYSLQRDFVR
jgi:hypothetical protein